jgi:DNA-binding NtrC family response regulator
MGSISETLFESELFGHLKGAFTDAKEDRVGKFEAADGGTLFLDEIGNLSLKMQTKLLSVIQNRTVIKVGSNQPIPVDIRLVCATNCDLEKMVSDGLFREDLMYRINTIHVDVPPLRNRGEDILFLSQYFLEKFMYKYAKPDLRINQAAKDKLLNYKWPGNVRELQHTIERAVILSEGSVLKPSDFFLNSAAISSFDSFPNSLEEMEALMIDKALKDCDGNYTMAADRLGITRQTLYNKIKKHKD